MAELELQVAWDAHVSADTAWLEAVVARHRQPHRRYHDVRHVAWVVRHALALARRYPVGDLGAVIAAAFFHDAVYDPTAADNEAQSARLARRALGELGWAPDRIDAVTTMIEATAGHAVPDDEDVDTAVLLASDLAVLAADPAGYAEYVTGVRAEYGHVSDADWRVGRGRVLTSLLERPAIYAPRLALEAWERRARANLSAERAALGDPSDRNA